jgi:SAM-dependent methyltransferase
MASERSGGAAALRYGLVEVRHREGEEASTSRLTYDVLHGQQRLRQRDSFYLWLVGLLSPELGRRLLDVSSGQGVLVHFAHQAGVWAVGLDCSAVAVATGWAERGAAAAVGDAEALPYPDDWFDYVTNIGSLEHYSCPTAGVREMARVLKTDGLAYVLLPNTFSLVGNIQHVWRTGDVFDDGQPLQRYGTHRQWRRLLEESGLKVIQTWKYEREWPRTWADWRWHLSRPARLLHSLLVPLVPLNLANCFVFACRKDLARCG